MFSAKRETLPKDALLQHYARQPGHYTDCYTLKVPIDVDLEAYVAAFYTTWLFKLERFLLASFANRPSTDEQAKELAAASLNEFAAWTVEDREPTELLMCDMSGRTRSWFRVEKITAKHTKLVFGSAVVPVKSEDGETPKLGLLFDLLLGFHKLYSKALLTAAAARLQR